MAATEVATTTEGAERKRWSLTLRLPTLLFLVLLAAGAGLGIFLSQYEPLGPGSMGGVIGAQGSRSVETLGEQSLIWLDHQEGEEFFAAFTIGNDGPLAVTIERFFQGWTLPSRDGGPFYPVEVLVHPGERFIGAEDIPFDEWDTFSPFSLSEGEERRVAVRFAFGECSMSRGETFGMDGAATRYSVLGIDRETYYQFPYMMAMKATPEGDCP